MSQSFEATLIAQKGCSQPSQQIVSGRRTELCHPLEYESCEGPAILAGEIRTVFMS